MKLNIILLIFSLIALKDELNLGDKLLKKDVVGIENLLIFPSQMEDCYIIKKENIIYDVTITKDSIINYITTNDVKFKTTEGYKVGSCYKDIKSSKFIIWNGWGRFINLNSGWNAVFKDESLNDNSKVLFFFKFNKKLGKTKKKDNLNIKFKF